MDRKSKRVGDCDFVGCCFCGMPRYRRGLVGPIVFLVR
jgi:hypothetical protein